MRATLILPILAAASALGVNGHPGSGIALDSQGRVYFTAGASIMMIETNGVARTIMQDQ